MAAPAAYVVARLPVGPRYALVVALLVTRMFPEFAVGVSVATRFARLGLVDTYLGLVLAHLSPRCRSSPGSWSAPSRDPARPRGGGGGGRGLARDDLPRVIFPAAAGGDRRGRRSSSGSTPGTSSSTRGSSPPTRTRCRSRCSRPSTAAPGSRWRPWRRPRPAGRARGVGAPAPAPAGRAGRGAEGLMRRGAGLLACWWPPACGREGERAGAGAPAPWRASRSRQHVARRGGAGGGARAARSLRGARAARRVRRCR